MLKKNLIAVSIIGILFTFASLINAQEKTCRKERKQNDDATKRYAEMYG